MRKALIIFSLLILSSIPARAQSRGEGVGALFTDTQGGTTITISNVKTAPWSEVIVETEGGNVQAAAKLDGKGLVNFTLKTVSQNVGSLYIYAVDEAGVSNKVLIEGTTFKDEVLPPTIVGQEQEEDSITLSGFTFPGAQVNVTVTSQSSQTLATQANSSTGAWELSLDTLEEGEYTTTAVSTAFGETSQSSQEVTFQIGTQSAVEQLVSTVTNQVKAAAQGLGSAAQATAEAISKARDQVTRTVQSLPESVKEAANTTSKAAAPISFLGLLLQAGFFSLKDFLALGSRYLAILQGVPLLPVLSERKRKTTPWGVVYDATTKNPIDKALVRLVTQEGSQKDMEITDETGAFSFLPQEGEYKLEVSRPGYEFPSQIVEGEKDGEYRNIYKGGAVETTEDKPTVNLSVPLDPNHAANPSKLKSLFKKHGSKVNMVLLTSGLTTSAVAYISFPTLYNQVVALLYLFVLALLTADTLKMEQTWGKVEDENGNPVEGVVLSLVDAQSGKTEKRRVTNERGLYQFVAPRGHYKILVSSLGWERISEGKYYTGEEIEVRKETKLVTPPIKVTKKPETALKRRETI